MKVREVIDNISKSRLLKEWGLCIYIEYGMIGGFHLFCLSDDEVRAFARRVRDTGIEYVVTGHCTGQRAYEILHEELGDKVIQMYSGLELDL